MGTNQEEGSLQFAGEKVDRIRAQFRGDISKLVISWQSRHSQHCQLSTHNLFIETFAKGGFTCGLLLGTFFDGSVLSDAL
jgi:hypothetical protein